MDLRPRLTEIALGAGIARVGFARAEAFTEVGRSLTERKASGLSGQLAFTFRQPEVASDPKASFTWAKTLIVGAWPYHPARTADPEPAMGRVAAAARTPGYEPLRRALGRVATALEAEGRRAEVLCDDNRLVDRAAAHRAGIGWWGKNTMIIAPGLGPWFLLGSVVTDALIEADEPMKRDCGTCSACLPACPTGALVAPGILDARRCLAAWAQTPGIIPEEFRVAMGNRIYGCDDCLEACPPGQRVESDRDATRFPLDDILYASDATLLNWFGHWYLPDRDPDVIRRNALIAVGNSGEERLVESVRPFITHPDPTLRESAEWALERLRSPTHP